MEKNINYKCLNPVVFLVFNRPEHTKRVFDAISNVQPNRLFIIADGPRGDYDKKKCDSVREIVSNVNWECDVSTIFRDQNIGCRKSVSSGISWAFDYVDRAIILEDDTVPDSTFFAYCDELLKKYEDETRIMHISGVNFSDTPINESYYFSRIPQIWGWATWRRSWNLYDASMSMWPKAKEQNMLGNMFGKSPTAEYWKYLFENTYRKNIHKMAWDTQWVFTCMYNQGYSINPSSNLVTNIGFGDDATHSTSKTSKLANKPSIPIDIPLRHPNDICVNKRADSKTMKIVFRVNNSLVKKARWIIKSTFPSAYAMAKRIYTSCKANQRAKPN